MIEEQSIVPSQSHENEEQIIIKDQWNLNTCIDDDQGIKPNLEHLPQRQLQNLEQSTTSSWSKDGNDD